MPYYAQIEGGKVVAVTEASGEIIAPHMVLLESFDTSLIGYSYADGVFTAPPPPLAPAPAVTMRQARLALHAAGLLDDVAAAIAALSEPAKTAAQIEWEYAQDVARNHGLVLSLAPALGLDDAALDALFAAAAGY